jgi:hypothetical protein
MLATENRADNVGRQYRETEESRAEKRRAKPGTVDTVKPGTVDTVMGLIVDIDQARGRLSIASQGKPAAQLSRRST